MNRLPKNEMMLALAYTTSKFRDIFALSVHTNENRIEYVMTNGRSDIRLMYSFRRLSSAIEDFLVLICSRQFNVPRDEIMAVR
jgi:hypothetical protein